MAEEKLEDKLVNHCTRCLHSTEYLKSFQAVKIFENSTAYFGL